MYYIDRMTDKSNGEARYELFCEAGMWKKALEEAVKLGDGRKIAIRLTFSDFVINT